MFQTVAVEIVVVYQNSNLLLDFSTFSFKWIDETPLVGFYVIFSGVGKRVSMYPDNQR